MLESWHLSRCQISNFSKKSYGWTWNKQKRPGLWDFHEATPQFLRFLEFGKWRWTNKLPHQIWNYEDSLCIRYENEKTHRICDTVLKVRENIIGGQNHRKSKKFLQDRKRVCCHCQIKVRDLYNIHNLMKYFSLTTTGLFRAAAFETNCDY